MLWGFNLIRAGFGGGRKEETFREGTETKCWRCSLCASQTQSVHLCINVLSAWSNVYNFNEHSGSIPSFAQIFTAWYVFRPTDFQYMRDAHTWYEVYWVASLHWVALGGLYTGYCVLTVYWVTSLHWVALGRLDASLITHFRPDQLFCFQLQHFLVRTCSC